MNKISRAIDFLIEDDPLFNNPVEFNDEWLDKFVDGTWTRRADGKINVEGHVDMSERELDKIPFQFGEVTGNFDCSFNNLTSLEGAPEEVGDDFNCLDNPLESLEGAPDWVGGFWFGGLEDEEDEE